MLVDPKQRISCPAAQAVIRRLHGRLRASAALPRWRRRRLRRRAW
jgi:hypothetical protein